MSFPILIKNLYNKNKELYLSMSRNKKGGKKKQTRILVVIVILTTKLSIAILKINKLIRLHGLNYG